jgi:hypothetical protein
VEGNVCVRNLVEGHKDGGKDGVHRYGYGKRHP